MGDWSSPRSRNAPNVIVIKRTAASLKRGICPLTGRLQSVLRFGGQKRAAKRSASSFHRRLPRLPGLPAGIVASCAFRMAGMLRGREHQQSTTCGAGWSIAVSECDRFFAAKWAAHSPNRFEINSALRFFSLILTVTRRGQRDIMMSARCAVSPM